MKNSLQVPVIAAMTVLSSFVACQRAASPVVAGPSAPSIGLTTAQKVGFDGPENLVYDPAADVYLVSNVGGNVAARDNNGFISRVSADGRVLDLKWIAGGKNGAVLDSPKGLALHGDTLAVADIGGVRLFNRRTGASIGTITLPGGTMNDVAFADDGSIWVTDTGPDRTTPIDTTHDMDAVWRAARDGRVSAVARGLSLGRPDGLVLDGTGALVSTFGAHRIERVGPGVRGGWSPVDSLPGGRVDGLRRLGDGSLLVTSWDAATVWRIAPDGTRHAVLTGVKSPAGVAVDTRRSRIAVTSMLDNALYLVPLR